MSACLHSPHSHVPYPWASYRVPTPLPLIYHLAAGREVIFFSHPFCCSGVCVHSLCRLMDLTLFAAQATLVRLLSTLESVGSQLLACSPDRNQACWCMAGPLGGTWVTSPSQGGRKG